MFRVQHESCGVAHVFRQAFDQAAVGHGLDAEQVDHLPHGHVLLGHLADPRDVSLTWVGDNNQRSNTRGGGGGGKRVVDSRGLVESELSA